MQQSICTHQWDTEQLSNPQGKKFYCPTAHWLVLMLLLEPRKHSMGSNGECCAWARRSPSPGLLCSLLPFHYFHYSTQVRPSFLCADTCHSIKGLLRYLFAFRQTWKATTSTPTLCKTQPRNSPCRTQSSKVQAHTWSQREHSCQCLVEQGIRTNNFYQPLDAFYFLLLLC